ncbi:hypothetical protein BC833DRAFT_584239 [Globomyces pollinis-pini]|nr:hypothetical protein BC833DRAFT_584239 [Globomyces pollinis-pini]KAJ2999252.1 hypothetical protein HDV02_003346 [Globomyces sp. JEL0801]
MDVLKNFIDVWNYIPTLALDVASRVFFFLLDLLTTVFNSLPKSLQNQLLYLATYSDVIFGIGVMFALQYILGRRVRVASFTDVFLTLFCSAICVGVMVFFLFRIVGAQSFTHQELKGEAEEFVAMLPFDFNNDFHYKYMTSFLETSRPIGRFWYGCYLFFDSILIICGLILNRQLVSITSKEQDQGTLTDMIMQHMPLLLAALDAYENASIAVILFEFAQMYKGGPGTKLNISGPFIQRVSAAIRAKLTVTYVLTGMQLSKLVQHFADKKLSNDTKPVEDKTERKAGNKQKSKKKK